MTSEDDRLRQALSRGEPSFTAHAALQSLRPTMQRARLRRRVTAGAATLALVAGTGVGVLAVATSQNAPTLRTVNNDDTDQSVLPEPTTVPPTTQAPNVATTLPLVVDTPETTSSLAPDADDATPIDDNGRGPGAETPVPTVAPQPAATPPTPVPPVTAAPPPAAAAAISQTIASDCGDVLVVIENGTVRIVSITARPGYESRVSDDGPISIEIVLRGADDTCELHAELKSGVLDIEVQNPPVDG